LIHSKKKAHYSFTHFENHGTDKFHTNYMVHQ
jgi:hypothetical protein